MSISVEDAKAGYVEDHVNDFKGIEKKIVRKFDLIIIPCLCIAYLFSTLDKSNIGNARVDGLTDDLHLNGNEFGNCVSLLFVTYVIFETPAALALKKIGPKYLFSLCYLLFGVCCLCTSFVTGYSSLLATRMLTGLFESSIIPCINVYLTMLYTRSEMGKRCCIVYSSGAISGAFGGVLAYGLLHLGGVRNWEGWRWLFAIEGAMSVVFFPLLFIMLPTDPRTAWWLSAEEIKVLSIRLDTYNDFHQDERFRWSEVLRAFKDISTYIICLYQFCSDLSLFGISTFLPSIIGGMGYTSYKVQLMTIPVYTMAFLGFFLTSYFSDKMGLRGYFIGACMVCEIVGYIILVVSTLIGARYFACILIGVGLYACSGLSVVWAGNNTAGHYKRATVTGLCLSIGNIGGVVSGQIFTTENAPLYLKGLKVALGTSCLAFVLNIINVFIFSRRNKRNDNILATTSQEEKPDYIDDRSPYFKFLL